MNLSTLIKQYVIYRKSLGEKFKSNEGILKAFCKTVGKRKKIKEISEKMINKFLYRKPPITMAWFTRYSALNGFYQYLISRKFVNKSPLPKILPKKPEKFIPYIYSKEEIKNILKVALTYSQVKSHNQPIVIRMVLFVLYSTGLRLKEALSLKLSDIDLDQQVLIIRQTKFFKSRLIPFNHQFANTISDYLTWRKNFGHTQEGDSPLFISKEKLPISASTINKIFQKIRVKASISRNDNARYQPRMHDLRHTFAVHRLVYWYKENKNVQKLLPILSAYMGHSDLAHTSVYLTMTDSLLHEAGKLFEKYTMGGAI